MDFNTMTNRKQTGSVKWDMMGDLFGDEECLPMWVADMDFENATSIKEALKELIDQTILGYDFPKDSLFESIINWQADFHGMDISKEEILFSPGVLPSISSIIQAFTKPGDGVLIHDPVYGAFSDMVLKNDLNIIRSTLLIEDNRYVMDYDDMEKQLKNQSVKLFILCNPHNPGGRVWTREELKKVIDLCIKHNVLIISDEIHSDLVFSEHTCVSAVTIDERYKDWVITLHSATKTFNLAGIKASFLIIYNEELRHKTNQSLEKAQSHTINSFGMCATEAAFNTARDWHKALLVQLDHNRQLVKTFFDKQLPHVSYMVPEATYLFWFDASSLGVNHTELTKAFVTTGKVALNAGSSYGPSGSSYMRLNFAMPQSLVEDGLNRVKKVFDTHST